MEDNEIINSLQAFEKRNVPRVLNIKGYDLTYKDPPLKGNIFRYRCRKVGCNYFVKIDQDNIEKINKNEKEIKYTEINTHVHKNEILTNINTDNVLTEKDCEDLAIKLIKKNLNEPLDFHITNFANNKIIWKKNKIRKLLYNLREEAYPKDELFLNNIIY